AQAHADVNCRQMAVDPVCGMTVDADQPKGGHVVHASVRYAFCSPSCAARFRAEPERYLQPPEPVAAPPGEYTCPMHPEVVQLGPGSCPICGMALEPKQPVDEAPNPELVDMRRRFWVSLLLTAPLFVLAMSEMTGHALGRTALWAELALST